MSCRICNNNIILYFIRIPKKNCHNSYYVHINLSYFMFIYIIIYKSRLILGTGIRTINIPFVVQ